MDEQPDIVSSGPDSRHPGPRHPGQIVVTLVVLGCLGVIAGLAVTVVHRDDTIASLREQLHRAQRPAAAPARLTGAGSAVYALPSVRLGSYSIGAAAVRAEPGSAELTWIFVYGQHVQPGERYGLLQGRCGGQFVTPADLADGTADRNGDLTIAVPDPGVSPAESDIYLQLYRLDDGTPLGGVRGPLVGGGAQTFVSKPSCPSLFPGCKVQVKTASTAAIAASWPTPEFTSATAALRMVFTFTAGHGGRLREAGRRDIHRLGELSRYLAQRQSGLCLIITSQPVMSAMAATSPLTSRTASSGVNANR